jgi:tetratricopeptide (TPR) repeat protein
MEISERNGVTPSDTVSPKPDYAHSLKIYQQLAAEYPDFTKIREAYYQMMTIHSLCGDLAKIKELCVSCAERYPQWSSCDRPLQYCDSGGNDSCYLKKLELMKESEMDKSSWEMLNYRKAELNYQLKRFDKAVELFNSYIEKCDSGLYQKSEFRDMSLEFLAICFSEMMDGYLKATDFFKRIGPRSYEPKVMYMIGRKYQSQGRYDEAISALSSALKRYPDYQDAPAARKDLNHCIEAKKCAKQ